MFKPVIVRARVFNGISRCVLSSLALIVMLSLAACQPQPPKKESVIHQLQGNTMGTSWSVQLHFAQSSGDTSAKSSEVLADLQIAVEAELVRINQLMSTWDPNSQLSLFNHARHVEPVELHADTLHVIDAALSVSALTRGRYDITLAPVIQLWGFGSKLSTGIPSDEKIAQAMDRVGSAMLERTGNVVRKRHPQLSVDVSSLGKGFAVDQLGEVLESYGVEHYLAEIGGELIARGTRADGSLWRVGIEHPNGDVQSGLALQDTHVASSGSYRNYREEGGRRVSHIIDGVTGKPITHQLVAVTVLHDSTMLADAWATALLVIGEDEAKRLIKALGLSAQLIIRTDNAFDVFQSEGFSTHLIDLI